MSTAYVYDPVRTPRGKGKKDGSLYQASPVWLARTPLLALQQRNAIDTALVEPDHRPGHAVRRRRRHGHRHHHREGLIVSNAVTLDMGGDGILVAAMNLPGRPMNVVNDELMLGLAAAVERLADPGVKGLVLTSHKADFCAGGGLDRMSKWTRPEQAFEAARCFEKGVLRAAADANVGSIHGWGFAPFHGGALQFIDALGAAAFVARSRELAARFGPRFEPARVLVEQAASGGRFADGASA